MNKKIFFSIVMVFVFIAIFLVATKKDNQTAILPGLDSVPEIAMCYSYAKENSRGGADRAWLKSTVRGEFIKGEYHNLPAESDSKIGTFEGYLYPDAVTSDAFGDVWWYSFAEGMYVMEQLHFGFDDNSAVAMFGEMVDRGDGVYVYKNTDNLTKGFQMTKIDCDTLDIENSSSGSVIETEINPTNPLIPEDAMVACAMDAMMCPDGSYVGRVGPNCAFQACPGAGN